MYSDYTITHTEKAINLNSARIVIAHLKAGKGFSQGFHYLLYAKHIRRLGMAFYNIKISQGIKIQVAPLDHIYFICFQKFFKCPELTF